MRAKAGATAAIAEALDTSIANIERTRRQLVEEGFEAVLTRKYNPNSAPPRIFDGAAEAKLIALTLSPAPEGYARWSLRLLEEKVVELQHRRESQRQHDRADAKKNTLKPHLKQQWVIPPDASAAFVATMEDVLEVYQRPHDPALPAGVSRRNLEAADRRNARPDPREAGTKAAARLRI